MRSVSLSLFRPGSSICTLRRSISVSRSGLFVTTWSRGSFRQWSYLRFALARVTNPAGRLRRVVVDMRDLEVFVESRKRKAR